MAGDYNDNGAVAIDDVTALIAYIFSGGAGPICCAEGDANGDGFINIADPVYLIQRIFSAGPAPVCGPKGMECAQ